ncbi:hypothetical protein DRP04_00960 [Archaeoglobales archaeon]|nr:MAG: hypothetical protein DRP04_00960 [Archaeoglobales archaeon]
MTDIKHQELALLASRNKKVVKAMLEDDKHGIYEKAVILNIGLGETSHYIPYRKAIVEQMRDNFQAPAFTFHLSLY